ncbi:hypothetical protein QTA58_22470 [Neorhizobium sp. CSC1952]|uniref:hypothetical protein n=1 Tax=Neorhizobium sp. CSC1952 TaxID=2978974 RepID=UPI0025A6088D|nr:hypothetical protein [Rhizobium sp. CSC1952]WJR66920.1 hypothetical protein QTA58_22470 [Rhizobium sp. CSC1952]
MATSTTCSLYSAMAEPTLAKQHLPGISSIRKNNAHQLTRSEVRSFPPLSTRRYPPDMSACSRSFALSPTSFSRSHSASKVSGASVSSSRHFTPRHPSLFRHTLHPFDKLNGVFCKMRHILVYGAILGCLVASNNPASACVTRARLDLADVKFADVVVIGRISDYEHVLDPDARKRREDMMGTAPEPLRAILGKQSRFLSDYVRFQVNVDEVLAGDAPNVFPVTWDNSTFGEPEIIEPGSYLIAVRKSGAQRPPLRGASATIVPTPEPDKMTVLQAPCAAAFFFDAESEEAQGIRRILSTDRK